MVTYVLLAFLALIIVTVSRGLRVVPQGYEYTVAGLFTARTHILASSDPRQPLFPFGADRLGRCVFSRIMQVERPPGIDLPGIDIVGVSRGFGCPATRVTRQMPRTRPFAISTVDRRMPMYRRPKVSFSPHAPNASTTRPSGSLASSILIERFLANFWCEASVSRETPMSLTPHF